MYICNLISLHSSECTTRLLKNRQFYKILFLLVIDWTIVALFFILIIVTTFLCGFSFSLGELSPLMKTDMILQIPIAVIKPNVEEILSYFSQVLSNILDTHKYISMWGQDKVVKSAMKKGKLSFNDLNCDYFLYFCSNLFKIKEVLYNKSLSNVLHKIKKILFVLQI